MAIILTKKLPNIFYDSMMEKFLDSVTDFLKLRTQEKCLN